MKKTPKQYNRHQGENRSRYIFALNCLQNNESDIFALHNSNRREVLYIRIKKMVSSRTQAYHKTRLMREWYLLRLLSCQCTYQYNRVVVVHGQSNDTFNLKPWMKSNTIDTNILVGRKPVKIKTVLYWKARHWWIKRKLDLLGLTSSKWDTISSSILYEIEKNQVFT